MWPISKGSRWTYRNTGESYGRKENGKAPFTREEMKTIHTVLETELNEPISFTELFNI